MRAGRRFDSRTHCARRASATTDGLSWCGDLILEPCPYMRAQQRGVAVSRDNFSDFAAKLFLSTIRKPDVQTSCLSPTPPSLGFVLRNAPFVAGSRENGFGIRPRRAGNRD